VIRSVSMKKSDTSPAPDEKEDKDQILVRPPKSLKQKLKALADKKMGGGVSLSAYCVDVLHEHVRDLERRSRKRIQ
jgi:hypothetical protein